MTDNNPNIANLQDEFWDKYFLWPEDYFPFNLPACHLTKEQLDIADSNKSTITLKMDCNLALELRIVDENKNILHIFHPRSSETKEVFTENFDFNKFTQAKKIGIAFIWTFYIPFPKYAKKHPMGIILFDTNHFNGKNTIISITDTRNK